jgi:RNA polymerase sigma-70 factor (ECF subfamily)
VDPGQRGGNDWKGSTSDDADLVLAARNGSKSAFHQLVKKYHPKLVVVAQGLIGELWAEDVVQEAWLSVYQSLATFEGRSTVKTWLFAIVRNHAFTHLRREKRSSSASSPDHHCASAGASTIHRSKLPDATGCLSTDSPDAILEAEQLHACIDDALDKLQPAQQTVVIMRDIELMALEDISYHLELSNSNVRVLLHRGRAGFRQVVERYQVTGRWHPGIGKKTASQAVVKALL